MKQTSRKRGWRLDMNGLRRLSGGNCARNWNLAILLNGICKIRTHVTEWDEYNSLGFWDPRVQMDKKKKKKKKKKRELTT